MYSYMKITYFALKPTQVGEEVRQPGDLIPEAGGWPVLEGHMRDGRVAPVLVATLPNKVQEELRRWEDAQNKSKNELNKMPQEATV